MLNQAILVGRLTEDPKVITNENGKKFSNITIAVPRNFKNEDGVYETDFINVLLWNNVAENTVQYCKKGDLVGGKGRLERTGIELKIVAEKITFLSSNKGEEKNED